MGVIPSWRVVDAQPGSVVAPDERLRWGQTLALGVQHVIAMFGATVLAPLLTGFDPNVAILMSGIGTLIFFVTVGGRVPSGCRTRSTSATTSIWSWRPSR